MERIDPQPSGRTGKVWLRLVLVLATVLAMALAGTSGLWGAHP